METVIKKPESLEITEEERAFLLDRRAAAADHAPVKVADVTVAKLAGLSKADLQKLLDKITAGEIE